MEEKAGRKVTNAFAAAKPQILFQLLRANLEGVLTCLLLGVLLVASIFIYARTIFVRETFAPKEATTEFVISEFKGLILPSHTNFELKLYYPQARLWWFFYMPSGQSKASLLALSDLALNNSWNVLSIKENEIEFERGIDERKKYLALARWRRSSKNLEVYVTTAPIEMRPKERWRQVNIAVTIDRDDSHDP